MTYLADWLELESRMYTAADERDWADETDQQNLKERIEELKVNP